MLHFHRMGICTLQSYGIVNVSKRDTDLPQT